MNVPVWALVVVLLLGSACAQKRKDLQTYLASVYTSVPNASWAKLSDSQITWIFNNLTFYYQGAPTAGPTWPKGRVISHEYAGTTCDCLHINLKQCQPHGSRTNCQFWNLTTYLDMNWVKNKAKQMPSNSWFEGLTYWGEWGFPLSCRNNSWMKSQIYGWNRHMWLYPVKGLGYWFNTGKTAAAPNKVAWLIKYGVGTVGTNKTDIMDYMARTSCPNYKNTSSCDVCANPTGPGQCCCHGSGRNLGVQVNNYRNSKKVSWAQALSDVADMYVNGMFGEDGSLNWPIGTYFGYVNLLDNDILNLQTKGSYLSAQFTREPQHSMVGNEFGDPVYAFEVLMNYPNKVYSWSNFCSLDGTGFAQMNPLADIAKFTNHLTLSGKPSAPVSKWVPRPEFAAVFTQ